jgi:hypothetical protein
MTQKFLLIVGVPIFLAGMLTGFGWDVVASIGGSRLSAYELPFGSDLRVTIDSAGRIYVGDNFRRRIQRYSPTGHFEMGWFVETTSGIFVLRSSADDHIKLAASRRGGILTYASDGRLLSQVADDDAYSHYSALPETAGPYAVKGGLLPHIIDTRSGQTVIAPSLAKRLIASPFPSFAYCALGIALIAARDWQLRRALSKRAI